MVFAFDGDSTMTRLLDIFYQIASAATAIPQPAVSRKGYLKYHEPARSSSGPFLIFRQVQCNEAVSSTFASCALKVPFLASAEGVILRG
jgi:hypothetical protein